MAQFELNLENNLFQLHENLLAGIWMADPYISFRINDPKPRIIHKASVRDRVLFQAVYRKLYSVFDPTFIFDSYSSRVGGGTHRAVKRLESFAQKVSGNHRNPAFALKCDIRKFFDSIDHKILKEIIRQRLSDPKLLHLISVIIDSFETESEKGLPLGNVTSQLFTNIYLNELDQFVKHNLKEKYYVRYCDDFVFLSSDRKRLGDTLRYIVIFLRVRLCLNLHARKVIFRKIHSGIDFLGYVVLPHRTVLRTKTKRRILKKIQYLKLDFERNKITNLSLNHSVQSYLGILHHCKGKKIEKEIVNIMK